MITRPARKNSSRRPRTGFTLIEMIVATLVLAIGIVGAASAFSAATKASALAADTQTASLLAQQQLEQTETQAAGQLTGGDTEGDFGADYPGYHWKQSITSTDYTYLFQVSVTVTWGPNPPRERTVTTYLVNTQTNTSTSTTTAPTGGTGG